MLRAELLAVQEALKDAITSHVGSAQVVVTTTTQGYLSTSPISTSDWDNVVIDEVTMVPPALCLYLASLAKERLLLTGDPQQLGPVMEFSNRFQNAAATDFQAAALATIWLGQDIFLKSGLSTTSTDGRLRVVRTDDERLCRLTAQRRCAAEIWQQVRSLYPEVGRLTDEQQLRCLAELPPQSGRSVVVMDLSGNADAKCEHAGKSWSNRFSAERAMEVAVTLAAEAAGPLSIAIITPYRGQVRLLRKYVKDELATQSSPILSKGIRLEVGTVHQFQGSEADVVIFDLVDAKDGVRRASCSVMILGFDWPTSPSLALVES